jgi:hypothetical protein
VFSVGFGSLRGRLLLDGRGDAGYAGSWSGKAQLGIWIAQTRGKDRIVFMTSNEREPWEQEFGHGMIVYRPKHEHFGNYVPSKIPYRYNAFI